MYLRAEEKAAQNIKELEKVLCDLCLERDRLPKSVAYMPLCNFANNFNLDYCLHKYTDSKSNCPLHKNCKRQLAIIEIHKKIEEKQTEIKAEMERYHGLCKNL